MIDVLQLKNMIRYKLKDSNEVTYSDYDILNAINQCLRYVNQYYANSDFLEKIEHISEDDINKKIDDDNTANGTTTSHIDICMDGTDLPDDFICLVRVVRQLDGADMFPCPAIKHPMPKQYKVLQNKIYLGAKDVDMLYNAAISEVSSLSGTIELPVIFKDALCTLICTILVNNPDTDTMSDTVNSTLDSLIPLRRYSNSRKRMPFIC